MTLVKSSVLHYWSSRYGINARVGGRPVFTRNTAGAFASQESEVDFAIVNTPRFNWATLNLPSGLTDRRKVLTLEMARNNNIFPASDLSSALWTKINVAPITTGIADPGGGTRACTITANAATGQVFQQLANGASIVRTNTAWIRRRTGVGTISMIGPDGVGVAVAVTAAYQRFRVTPAASIARWLGYVIATNGDAIDVWLGDQEDANFQTSEIDSTSGVGSRAADSCLWTYPSNLAPQAMMAYVRFVERGTIIGAAGGRVLNLGSATAVAPFFLLFNISSVYSAYHDNATLARSSNMAAVPAIGDTVELLGVLYSDGSVECIQSINGAAVTSGGQSASAGGFNTAWHDTQLQLNSSGAANVGANDFADVKLVKFADVVAATAQGRMDELRAFELGPNGEVL